MERGDSSESRVTYEFLDCDVGDGEGLRICSSVIGDGGWDGDDDGSECCNSRSVDELHFDGELGAFWLWL